MLSSNLHTRLLEVQEYSLWDDFVDRSAMGTLFHKTIWLENISRWQKLKFNIAGCFKGTELAGGMAFCWKNKMNLIPIIQMPVKTPYFGIVFSDRTSELVSKHESHIRSISRSITEFLEQKFRYIYTIFPPGFMDIRPFIWEKYIAQIHYTYRFELNSEKDLLNSLHPSLKRQIKKSLLFDFKIQKDNSVTMLSTAWELEQKSFERQGFRFKYSKREEFVDFLETIISQDYADVYTLIYQNKAIACNIIVKDLMNKTTHYWLAGAQKEYLNTGLNRVLLFKTIEDLKSSDMVVFDFEGAGTENIVYYKSRYNFPLVPMYSVTKTIGLAKYAFMLKKLFR